MQEYCLSSHGDAGKIYCIIYVNCSHSREITQPTQAVEQIQKQRKDILKRYDLADSNRLGISTRT
ncbi:hypothetical protein NIES3585_34420 [Nodularia sp. NIES-3585]|nr:hypothetical protein NIES3585_34420 [Nodularia sp. NIES-3585]